MIEKDEDVPVIERILNGDTDAFEILLKKYQNAVTKIVVAKVPQSCVAEVTQDVFIRAFKSLSSYRGRDSLESWLKTIAVRTCYDYWRTRYRNRETPMSSLSESARQWVASACTDGTRNVLNGDSERVELREILDWALDHLSPTNRMVVLLLYFDGYSLRETSNTLGISIANVKIRAHRSRKKLRHLLGSLL